MTRRQPGAGQRRTVVVAVGIAAVVVLVAAVIVWYPVLPLVGGDEDAADIGSDPRVGILSGKSGAEMTSSVVIVDTAGGIHDEPPLWPLSALVAHEIAIYNTEDPTAVGEIRVTPRLHIEEYALLESYVLSGSLYFQTSAGTVAQDTFHMTGSDPQLILESITARGDSIYTCLTSGSCLSGETPVEPSAPERWEVFVAAAYSFSNSDGTKGQEPILGVIATGPLAVEPTPAAQVDTNMPDVETPDVEATALPEDPGAEGKEYLDCSQYVYDPQKTTQWNVAIADQGYYCRKLQDWYDGIESGARVNFPAWMWGQVAPRSPGIEPDCIAEAWWLLLKVTSGADPDNPQPEVTWPPAPCKYWYVEGRWSTTPAPPEDTESNRWGHASLGQ